MDDTFDIFLPDGDILTIRRATSEDVSAAVAIEVEAAAWLRARGIEPGQPPRPLAVIFAESIARGQLYLALLDGQPVGKITLQPEEEPLWADLPGRALYVHGLTVRHAYAGRQIGLTLLRWAEQRAALAVLPWLRLDCNSDNSALRAYYERAGFTSRGDVALPHRVASRYERATGV
ncbi:MAG TPA: GNAT family N-acetyltransferase [Ktedonobacterales bacterium]